MTKLLIVEDEQILSLDLTRHLEDMGYTVVGAVKSSDEAVAAAQEKKPDLILMDVRIQGDKDGFQTAALIRAEMDVAIIFMTAYSDEGTIQKAKMSGGYGYIQKPIRHKELQTNIDMVIERHSMQKKVTENQKRYKNLIETIPYGIIECTPRGIITVANSSIHDMLGYEDGYLQSKIFTRFVALAEDVEKLLIDFQRSSDRIRNSNLFIGKLKTASGRDIDVQINWSQKRDAFGTLEGLVASITDITSIREAETLVRESVARANFLEYYDTLTGLPNRKMLLEQLHLELKRAEARSRKAALLILGIDRFKNVNQLYNPAVGDELLKSVSQRLRATMRDDDLVTRLAGDKFGIICSDIPDANDVIDIVSKIKNIFSLPFIVEEREIRVTSSIGISIYPNDGDFEEMLIKNAEVAMDIAKQKGGEHYSLFDQKMNERLIDQIQRETEIQDALINGEFIPFYQPKIDNKGVVQGMEALARWDSKIHGKIMSPYFFIEIAEKNGIIVELGNDLFFKVCKQIQSWLKQGVDVPKIAVNISPIQFQHESLIYDIQTIIRETGVKPKHLEFEITETGIMANEDEAIEKLKELHGLGISLSIDDFGTGYSSLSKLKDYPIDNLKIDKSFVDNIIDDKKSYVITTTIIDLAHNLGYKVIAEGVETLDQLNLLKKHNCDLYQGYYYSKPLSATQLLEFLNSRKSVHS